MLTGKARTGIETGTETGKSPVAVPPFAFALGLAVALGCTGLVGGGGSGGPGPGGDPDRPIDPGTSVEQLCAQMGPTLHVGRTRLRRLTRPEYNNTVRDLLGLGASASLNSAAGISPDERIGPFYSNAIAPITDLIVQQHQEAATSLAAAALSRMDAIAGCSLASDTAGTCLRQFVSDFGRRAYRRPLDPDEIAAYVTVYGVGKAQADAQNGFRLVLEAMLQSPFFLYHVDVGAAGTPSVAPVPLAPYELASRLSYFLWSSMPDKTLLDLAGSGALTDKAMLASQVTRMLADSRAADAVPAFHLAWLGLADMDDVSKDTTMFPQWNDAMVSAMRAETTNFTDYVVRRGDGMLTTLLTAGFSFPEGPLFSLYGVAQPSGYAPGMQVTLKPGERSGVLTQAAFLATHAHRDQTSPVHRGIIVRENMLCTPIPAPPPDVNATPLPPVAGKSTRERFAAHESDPRCGGCHTMMDPIGLAFENYDAVGAYRTSEGSNMPVDATGEVRETNDPALAGTFVGVVELGQKLAASRQVSECVANQWFRFALGRMEANDDACAMTAIHQAFVSSGGNIRDLLTTIVQSDAFLNVRSVGDGT